MTIHLDRQCPAAIVGAGGKIRRCSIPLSSDGGHGLVAHQSVHVTATWVGSEAAGLGLHTVMCPNCYTDFGVVGTDAVALVREAGRI